MVGEPGILLLKNGPAYPFDLCFDFGKSRIILLRAANLSLGSRGPLATFMGRGKGVQKEQYELVEGLTIEQRVNADKESILIPFDSVVKLALSKSWGRPPVIVLETDLTGDKASNPKEVGLVRKHEFMLSSDRDLQKQQVSLIRQALPDSKLGQRFVDRMR